MASGIMGTPPPLSSTRSSPPSSPSRSSPSSGSFNSDDSELELSFDYIYDDAGKVVRVSKGSSRQHSGPPTPPKTTELPTIQASASNMAARRSSLSRSESLPGGSSIVPPVDALSIPANQLSRTASGPVSMATPAPAPKVLGVVPLSGGLNGTGRKIGGAQRIRRSDAERQRREIGERIRREEEAEREQEREQLRRAAEEKENQRQSPPGPRPIVSLSNRQTFQSGPSRTTRSTATARIQPSISEISEHEASESEFEEGGNLDPQDHQPHQLSYLPASKSLARHQSSNHPRPAFVYGSAYGYSARARRVTAEERLRQEQELAEEHALAEVAELQEKRSPSPLRASMNGYHSQSRTRQALYQRQEPETLRSGIPIPQYTRQEDIGMDQHPRLSPSSRSLGGTTVVQDRIRAERSPPAPARPKSAAGEYAEVNENRRSQRTQRQQSVSVLDPKKNFIVNRKAYARLDMIGKGGSSRVYRVMDNQTNEIYAVKRVSFDKNDDETVSGYMNEISLLNRLEGNRRVIKLLDNELKGAGNGSKGTLFLIMECGEIDLARLLQEQQKEPMNILWIAYYWQQILEAVQVIHDEKIVHSDLKPANFVLVKGQLKLIDFGIAKAIANDTTNIQRDHQIGTVNYMSPEAIEIPDGMRRLKVGRPSDVWSLGCILYQMVYGHPPFHALTVFQKMKAIPDRNHVIEFPEVAVPSIPAQRSPSGGAPLPPTLLTHLTTPVRRDVIRTMQVCLVRDAKQRATIPELLEDDWLSMKEPTPSPPPPTLPPPPAPELKEDEAIITPIFMKQLLSFGISCDTDDWSEEELERKAIELVVELRAVNPYRA